MSADRRTHTRAILVAKLASTLRTVCVVEKREEEEKGKKCMND